MDEMRGVNEFTYFVLRDCFLKAFLDTDVTDCTEFYGKTIKKRLFSVLSVVKSVYKKMTI